MQYNRGMIGLSREGKILRKAERNPTAAMVLLMNEYHSSDLRYFPTENDRKEHKSKVEDELKKLNRRLPSNLSGMMYVWMNNASLWREAVENIHI
mgnify:CR=1 FL=1